MGRTVKENAGVRTAGGASLPPGRASVRQGS